ncbi:MAG TPA: tRNA (N6-threonylcarbamoyladenosine(37)-N6)-methyltransferase TrmO [Methanothrix sp.]|nr:tRNA (N6-threonylcarbamoyladenosine(37)-N6)-methyltransferase TrmO [Methanothrix sp.]HPC89162.1 tRNA (N6-threonylcarbamoyladenosine(37)-N6)-methyltransferase TrmO [Methanothrix sp.]HQI67549.1 tRNA (N6-threonylcarbamoyladenosine(37)-N6)-methyltransferase TrmO [Methanothrix sp.]HRS84450.1 tRNA (N6-threonylcarbamoyladenosine(37)-N6)-methyltransferase TrmO [Methanothrix sp.]HRT16539.1 tRNA (N6-threonylcarbamoyladenosine(37)-N6)-methyltransferase TrmO [Methanothrix sp.]
MPFEEIGPMVLRAVGVIHTPYLRREDIPRQGRLSNEICEIEVFPQYAAALKDIDQCSHLFVIFWLHMADRERLSATPPHDGKEHGVFATRSPNRPNPLALDVVELVGVEGERLKVRGMDALDGSILLDIKPYSAGIDCFPQARIAWQEKEGRKAEA